MDSRPSRCMCSTNSVGYWLSPWGLCSRPRQYSPGYCLHGRLSENSGHEAAAYTHGEGGARRRAHLHRARTDSRTALCRSAVSSCSLEVLASRRQQPIVEPSVDLHASRRPQAAVTYLLNNAIRSDSRAKADQPGFVVLLQHEVIAAAHGWLAGGTFWLYLHQHVATCTCISFYGITHYYVI